MDTHAPDGPQPLIGPKDWRPASDIKGYHAHIYYDGKSKKHAGFMRREIERLFTVTMGRWRDKEMGPHPVSFYQVAFGVDEFPKIVPWLALNRGGLDILIHPETGDAYEDHVDNMLWLGRSLDLNADVLKK